MDIRESDRIVTAKTIGRIDQGRGIVRNRDVAAATRHRPIPEAGSGASSLGR